MIVEVPVNINLSPREVEAAATCGLTADEYARRKVAMVGAGMLIRDGMFHVLAPLARNEFEIKEISI